MTAWSMNVYGDTDDPTFIERVAISFADACDIDGGTLKPGARVTVYLDAYPDIALPAHFESASPMASSALGSPIKTFTAVFKFDKTDARLLPDLTAAIVIEPASGGGSK